MGKFLPAREHLETVLTQYDPNRHRSLTLRYGWADTGARSRSYAALTLWQLGYPDQALRVANEALTLAQSLSHPLSLTFAGNLVGLLRQLRREARATQDRGEYDCTFRRIWINEPFGLRHLLAWMGADCTGARRRWNRADTRGPRRSPRNRHGIVTPVSSLPLGGGMHKNVPF
jgi:hypothetical protein